MSGCLHNSAAILLLIVALFETTGLGTAQNLRPHFRLLKRQAIGRSSDYEGSRFFPFNVQAPAPAPAPPCLPTGTPATGSTSSMSPPSDTTPYPTQSRAYAPEEQPSSLSLISSAQLSPLATDDAQPHIEYIYGGDDFDQEDTNDDPIAHPAVVSFAGDDDDDDDDSDDEDEDEDDDDDEEVEGQYNVNSNNHHKFERPQVYRIPSTPYQQPIGTLRQSNIQIKRQRRRHRQRVKRIRRQFLRTQRRRRIQRRQHLARLRRQNAQRRYRNRVQQEYLHYQRMSLQQQRRFRRQQLNSIRRHRANQNHLINLANRRRRG